MRGTSVRRRHARRDDDVMCISRPVSLTIPPFELMRNAMTSPVHARAESPAWRAGHLKWRCCRSGAAPKLLPTSSLIRDPAALLYSCLLWITEVPGGAGDEEDDDADDWCRSNGCVGDKVNSRIASALHPAGVAVAVSASISENKMHTSHNLTHAALHTSRRFDIRCGLRELRSA